MVIYTNKWKSRLALVYAGWATKYGHTYARDRMNKLLANTWLENKG